MLTDRYAEDRNFLKKYSDESEVFFKTIIQAILAEGMDIYNQCTNMEIASAITNEGFDPDVAAKMAEWIKEISENVHPNSVFTFYKKEMFDPNAISYKRLGTIIYNLIDMIMFPDGEYAQVVSVEEVRKGAGITEKEWKLLCEEE